MNDRPAQRSDFWLGFVFGGVIGGLLAFLFTTEKGKKIREKISENGGDWAGQAIDALGRVVNDLEGKTEEIREEGGVKLAQKLVKPLKELKALKKETETIQEFLPKSPQKSSRRRFFKKGSKRKPKKS